MNSSRNRIFSIAILVVLNFVGLPPLLSAETDVQQEYKQELTAFLSAAVKQDFPAIAITLNKLAAFSQNNPGSPFSDDVRFIILTNAFGANDFRLNEWESFVANYPDGEVEDVTKATYQEIIGTFPAEMNFPYPLWVPYIKASVARASNDWKTAAENYAQVIREINWGNLAEKEAAFAPYAMLLISYKKLGNREAFDKTKSEMMGIYPDKKSQLENATF